MGKFLDRLKNIFRGSRNGEFSPAPAKINTTEIEHQINVIVWDNIGSFEYLSNYRPISFSFWPSVIKAICYAESNFNPYERFYEKTMGYYSEGLMQLSYQDCKAYGVKLDKSKNEIFDIEKNILLGMTILDNLMKKHGHFVFNEGNYWAVLQPKNKRHQVFLKKFHEYYQGEL